MGFMIPTWLQRRIDTANPDGVTRRARATHCRKCSAAVIRGLDADMAALSVTADATPLNKLGEAIALLGNRKTYALHWRGDRYELNPRTAYSITSTPAGTNEFDVLAEHECGSVALPADTKGFTSGPTAEPAHSEGIPF